MSQTVGDPVACDCVSKSTFFGVLVTRPAQPLRFLFQLLALMGQELGKTVGSLFLLGHCLVRLKNIFRWFISLSLSISIFLYFPLNFCVHCSHLAWVQRTDCMENKYVTFNIKAALWFVV